LFENRASDSIASFALVPDAARPARHPTTPMLHRFVAPLLACALLAPACSDLPDGLGPTSKSAGPQVVFDVFARPLPDIPLPNDFATRFDPTSPTGRRLNVSFEARTSFERTIRAGINELDGFGTYAPITVSFDAPIDIGALLERHGTDVDPSDDALYVVALDPDSPDYGEPVALDIGRGMFPATLPEGTVYHPGDPRQGAFALMFESVDEDTNGNGRLDPGEDTDQDGQLDVPNVHPRGATPADGLMTFYERETNTLVLRPLVPLRERTEYAVVLTNRLVGEDGEPVRSPFATVNHTAQTRSLERLDDIFAMWDARGFGVGRGDVAFAWTFTTQTVTADLIAVREGLYGIGPLAWLADAIPVDVEPAAATTDPLATSALVLPGATLTSLVSLAFADLFDLTQDQVNGLASDMGNIDYVVQGWFTSPDFLTSDAPVFEQRWDVDLAAGEARVTPARLPFLAVIPKETPWARPPFRVAIYSHGFGQARVEPLAFAPALATYGIATIAIDTWGHGINLSDADADALLGQADLLQLRPFFETLLEGRATDVDGTGRVNAGADMFSAYAFHTRDTMRQSTVDHLQLVRAMRAFDGERAWAFDVDGDGTDDLAGDFDGDGLVDLGGPNQPYYVWGSSMGGLLSGVIGPLEPSIVGAAPVAGGAGLSMFGRRSRQDSVRNSTVMNVIGPIITGAPGDSGETVVDYHWSFANELRENRVGTIDAAPGDRLRLENRTAGTHVDGEVLADGTFALRIQVDRGDALTLTVERSGGAVDVLDTWSEDVFVRFDEPADSAAGAAWRTPNEGWGYHRGSPDLRRLVGLAQMVLEPGDPINYARHFVDEPLDIRPEGPTPTNLLVISTLGDPMNPSDVHVAAARGAGLFDLERDDPRYGMPAIDWLVANHVLEGVCGYDRFAPNDDGDEVIFDPDALDRLAGRGDDANEFGAPKPEPGDELRLTLETGTGQSGVRFGHMLPCGKHSFFLTDPTNAFNIDEYLNSLAGFWFATDTAIILDDGCHETTSCVVPSAP